MRRLASASVMIGLAVCALAISLPSAAEEGAVPKSLVGHGGPVKAIAIAPDGREALTASFDYSIIRWRLNGAEGEVMARLEGHTAAVNDVAFLPGSGLAVSVSDDGAFGIWDLSTNTLKAMIEDTADKVLDVAVSNNGRFAAAARWDGTARVYDVQQGVETAVAEGARGNVNAVTFSLDGQTLFAGSYDGSIRIYPVNNEDGSLGSPLTLYSHGWGINVLAPLPGGSQLAFGGQDGTIGVIDLVSIEMTELAKGEGPILSVAVSQREGLVAFGSADGFIRMFDTDTGAQAEEFHEGFGPIWGLAFMPDGKQLYRVGLDDFAINWQFQPRQPFEEVQSVYPRRFARTDVEDPGELEFLRKCSVCHTLTPDDANRAGPTLYGLFGRVAGSVEGYSYSDALINSDIVWSAQTVSQLFLEGPDVVTPGTKMPVQRLKSVERRDALIAYLEKATRPDGKTPPPGDMRPVN